MMQKDHHGTAGMTLVEIMIVVVMIGILAGISASKLDWMRYRADSVARGAVATLSLAERTAVSLQMDVRVTILTNDRIRVHEDANNNATIDTGERVTYNVLDDGFTFGRGSMAALPAPADPSELTTLVFRRDGSASRSGSFYISSPRADDTACHWCRGISITRITGRLGVYSYATGTWVRNN